MPESRPQLEFRVLGPVEALADGVPVSIAGRKARTLLLLLLVRQGGFVPTDTLIEELWEGSPPRTPENTLQVYVSQLRKALGNDVVVSRESAYGLAVDPGQIDTVRFERLASAAGQALAAGDPARAAALFRDALALWRGPVFGGALVEGALALEALQLDELRRAVVEDRFEAELGLGRGDELVADLRAAAADDPLRERLQAQLMLALYRSGRQVEALDAYQEARRQLDESLGLEPSRMLQDLQRAILAQDPALDVEAVGPHPAARPVRKRVTVVTCELGLGELDPELLAVGVASERLAATLKAGGAAIEHATAETVTAVFGVLGAREDEAARACQAVLDARSDDPTLRAGLASGEVLVEGTRVIGAALRRAGQEKERATPGEIVLDDETVTLLGGGGTVEARDGGGTRLLGIDLSVATIPRRFDSPLVGRADELERLVDTFERVRRRGSPALVNVLGVPGIGKSRLAHELRSAVSPEATVLTARCVPRESAAPLEPLAAAFAQVVPGELAPGLLKLLGDDPRAERVTRILAAVLELDDEPVTRGDLEWAARRVFQQLASESPLVVVLDDVQWAHELLLGLVEHVLVWASSSPILIVCLARPEFLEGHPAWGAGNDVATIELVALNEAESARLIELRGGGAKLVETRRTEIATAAEGNPLFIEQLLALLGTTPPDEAWSLPPTIQALLAARLELLEPTERALLENLAVAGRDVPADEADELAAAAGLEGPEPLLRALVEKQLLELPTDLGGRVYRFRHQLIADVAYAALPKAMRAELHERLAVHLEQAPKERLAEVDERAGWHLSRAVDYRLELDPGDPRAPELAERAARRLGYAGRRARIRLDMRSAVALLERALELAPAHVAERPERLLDLAIARRDLGEFAGAAEIAAQVEREAEALGQPALRLRAGVLLLRMRMQTDPATRLDELEAGALASIADLEQLDDAGALAEAEIVLGWVHWYRCHARLTEAAVVRGLERSRLAGDPAALRQALNLYLGAALFGPLPVDEGIARCEEVLAAPPDRASEAAALRALAGLRAMEGRFEDARSLLRRDREIIDELGLRVAAATASEIWTMVEHLDGDYEAAEAKLNEAHELLSQIGEFSVLSNVDALLAETYYRQGRVDETLAFAERARSTASTEDVCAQVYWRGPYAKALSRRGRGDEAEALAREAVALTEGTDFPVMRANALLDLAHVLAAGQGGHRAVEATRQALVLLETKGNRAAAARVGTEPSVSTG
jgi:DNA-binding SARP family transcriptional activator